MLSHLALEAILQTKAHSDRAEAGYFSSSPVSSYSPPPPPVRSQATENEKAKFGTK